MAAAEDFEGPRLQQAIGADCPKKDRTHKRIRVEESAIDRGKIMKLALPPLGKRRDAKVSHFPEPTADAGTPEQGTESQGTETSRERELASA